MLAEKLTKLDDGQLTRLMRVVESSGVPEQVLVIEAEQARLRQQNEEEPMICDEDITQDFRFRAGRLSLIRELLELPAKAKEMQENRS